MDEKEIKEAQISRINAFLAHHNASLDTLSKGRQKQLLQIDTAIQERQCKGGPENICNQYLNHCDGRRSF